MTTLQLIALIVSIIVVAVPIAALLVTVLGWVRKDSLATGKLSQQVKEFAEKLAQADEDRALLLKLGDERIADALKMSNEITAQREKDIIEAVTGFRHIVDDLKSEFSAIKNMWAGERKLIEQLRALELEIARLIEKFRTLEHDLMRLQLDHEKNHPRESGKISMRREDGAPHLIGDNDEGGNK